MIANLVPGNVLSTLQKLTSFILKNFLLGRYYYAHFMYE